MSATCSFDALPLPVMAILIFNGAYSVIGIWCWMAAVMATPCARPSFSIDCTFLPKKGASIAISSGRYVSMIRVSSVKIDESVRYGSVIL